MKLIKKTTVASVLIVFALLMPLVNAVEPRIVYNEFGPFKMFEVRVLKNGDTISKFKSEQHWTGGGWEGDIVQQGFVYTYADTDTQYWSGKGMFSGTIDGKTGHVKYLVWQIVPDGDFSQMSGSLTLVGGTRELKGIKGYGILVLADPPYTEIYMSFE